MLYLVHIQNARPQLIPVFFVVNNMHGSLWPSHRGGARFVNSLDHVSLDTAGSMTGSSAAAVASCCEDCCSVPFAGLPFPAFLDGLVEDAFLCFDSTALLDGGVVGVTCDLFEFPAPDSLSEAVDKPDVVPLTEASPISVRTGFFGAKKLFRFGCDRLPFAGVGAGPDLLRLTGLEQYRSSMPRLLPVGSIMVAFVSDADALSSKDCDSDLLS